MIRNIAIGGIIGFVGGALGLALSVTFDQVKPIMPLIYVSTVFGMVWYPYKAKDL